MPVHFDNIGNNGIDHTRSFVLLIIPYECSDANTLQHYTLKALRQNLT
jgi:hypothetical protein